MSASVLLVPPAVHVGAGASTEVGALVRSKVVGRGTVLVVVDPAVAGSPAFHSLTGSLVDAGLDHEIMTGSVGEPDIAVADAAAALARSVEAVAVVGVGGGSTMDVAKVASVLRRTDGSARDLVGIDRVAAGRVPLILVPTTAGTGAEATRIAMLTDEGRKAIVSDARLVPDIAVLDPAFLRALPAPVAAATGMDALAHAVESLLSTSSSDLTRAAAGTAIELLTTWLPVACGADHSPSGDGARQATLVAAYSAGVALNAGVVLGHSIAYTIANRTGLPHGVTTGMALPYCVAYSATAAPAAVAEIAGRLRGTVGQDRRTDESDAALVSRSIAGLSTRLGLPASLEGIGIARDELPHMVEECIERYPRPTNPAPLVHDRLLVLYEQLWRGDVADACAALR